MLLLLLPPTPIPSTPIPSHARHLQCPRPQVAYQLILADLFSTAAGTIIPAGAEPNRAALLGAITALGVVPVALFVRSPALLASVSQASVAYLLLFCGVVTTMALAAPPGSWQVGPGARECCSMQA